MRGGFSLTHLTYEPRPNLASLSGSAAPRKLQPWHPITLLNYSTYILAILECGRPGDTGERKVYVWIILEEYYSLIASPPDG